MMLPLIVLYEFGIFLSVGVYRRKAKKEEQYEKTLEPPDGAVGND